MSFETLITAQILPATGIMKDAPQLNFVVSGNKQPTPIATLDFTGPINTFLNAIGGYLSPALSRLPGGIVYKLYNITGHLNGTPHGSPIALDVGTLTQGPFSTKGLPAEVAVVLTLRGIGWDGLPVQTPDGPDPDLKPDRPRQRASGRLYLGPLNDGLSTPSGARPEPVILEVFRTKAKDMQASWLGQPVPLSWGVWSRKNASLRRVVQVETDDAFDTQRRRGVAPQQRIFTIVPGP